MAAKNQSYYDAHPAIDTPDQILKCLDCKKKECDNCIGNPPAKYDRIPEETLSDNERKYHMVLNKTDKAFLKYYPLLDTDRAIGEAIGREQSSVYAIRKKLELPLPRTVSREEREALIEDWIVK